MFVIRIKSRKGGVILIVQPVIPLQARINRSASMQAGNDNLAVIRWPGALITLNKGRPLHSLVKHRPPDFKQTCVDREDLLGLELSRVSRFAIVNLPVITVAF